MELQELPNPLLSAKNFTLIKTVILIVALILALSNNILHSTYLYYSISPRIFESEQGEWIYSIFVNLVVDFSVIAFAFNNRHKEAFFYAIGILAINLLFWKGVGLINDDELRKNIARVIYSIMFSCSVYIFTSLLAKRIHHKEEEFKFNDVLNLLKKEQSLRIQEQEMRQKAQRELEEEHQKSLKSEKENREMQGLINEAQELLKNAHDKLNTYEKERTEELSCKHCSFVGETRKQLGDHKRRNHRTKEQLSRIPNTSDPRPELEQPK